MSEEIIKLLGRLEKKYAGPLQLMDLLNKKYGCLETCQGDTEAQIAAVLFGCDEAYNRRTIERLTDTFGAVKNYANIWNRENTYGNENDSTTENKLLKKYEKELRKVVESDACSDGEKLAQKYVRLLKNTLLKLWGIKDYRTVVSEYFEKNGIGMESYDKGHKMTDDELCLLDGDFTLYKEITDDAARNYEVIEMIQPIIHISYYADEEDGIEYKDICGSCRFFYCSR